MHPCVEATWKTVDAYRVGTTVFEYNPAEQPVRHMLRLVAYDIRDPRRLRRVAKICQDYGLRVEYSVFECDSDEESFAELWGRLLEAIDPEEDAVLVYRLCQGCVKEVQSMGAVTRPERTLVYIT